MIIVVKREVVSKISFGKGRTVIALKGCGRNILFDSVYINEDALVGWGEQQHSCALCKVQYVDK